MLASCALVLTFAAASLFAQDSKQNPSSGAPAGDTNFREPQLLPPQQVWPSAGKCKTKRHESALLSSEISESGSSKIIAVLDVSDANATALAEQVLHTDRFMPAMQNGKPVATLRSILVEMDACVESVKLANGKKAEQLRLGTQPQQTIGPQRDPEDFVVHKVGGNISAPVPINLPEPEYTLEARSAHVEGQVVVSVIVDAHGVPHDAHVIKPLPAGLSEQALDVVNRYRFRPALKDGKTPVPVGITIVVNFKLIP